MGRRVITTSKEIELTESIKKLQNVLSELINSHALKIAPFITYSDVYQNAVELLKEMEEKCKD